MELLGGRLAPKARAARAAEAEPLSRAFVLLPSRRSEAVLDVTAFRREVLSGAFETLWSQAPCFDLRFHSDPSTSRQSS